MKERYLDIVDGVEIYKAGKDYTDKKTILETDGGIDTLFDTEYDEEHSRIVFGTGCAEFDSSTGILTIEGAVEVVEDPTRGAYGRIVIS